MAKNATGTNESNLSAPSERPTKVRDNSNDDKVFAAEQQLRRDYSDKKAKLEADLAALDTWKDAEIARIARELGSGERD